jgi:hypothetical protein
MKVVALAIMRAKRVFADINKRTCNIGESKVRS